MPAEFSYHYPTQALSVFKTQFFFMNYEKILKETCQPFRNHLSYEYEQLLLSNTL